MSKNEELIAELEKKYSVFVSQTNLKVSFDELNDIFGISDYILKVGYVSNNVSIQIRGRMVEYYSSAASYLHSLLLPNPQNMIQLNESKLFSSEEKKAIGSLIGKIMYFSSKNTYLNMLQDVKKEAIFIDEVSNYYPTFKKEMSKVMEKVIDYWSK